MIIIGTAGHIDHGKTTLVSRLTGVETDRLKEEKDRGISIELGFAYLDVPGGHRVGIIDVPGHERFVRQMIAGAVGVDLVVLVVAADEGVMPQTHEHLDICRLLGVQHGMIALTKADLVDPEWLALVQEDLADFVEGTFLEGAPCVPVSVVDETLLETFKERFHALLNEKFPEPPSRDITRPFKLSVDRAFTMRGFGSVVTGTAASGSLSVGEEVVLLPGSERSRVRGIQVHSVDVQTVEAGSRAAINLQGIEKSSIERGQVITRPGELEPTSMFDATAVILRNLPRSLETRFKALVHVGTEQLLGTVVLLDRAVAEPGDEVLIQVRLERPTVVSPGDCFVLRGFEVLDNYGKTLGGGRILDPHPLKHRSGEAPVVEGLTAMRDDAQLLQAILRMRGERGMNWSQLRRCVARSTDALRDDLAKAVSEGWARAWKGDEGVWLHADAYGSIRARALKAVDEYHVENRALPGIPREQLRGSTGWEVDPRFFAVILDDLTENGEVVVEGDLVKRPGFEAQLSAEQKALCDRLQGVYRGAGLQPPLLAECEERLSLSTEEVQEGVDILVRSGGLIRTKGGLCFAQESLDQLRERLVTHLEANGEITTLEFKELTGASRKFTIPLGEHFDAIRLTVRVGDNTRRLR